MMAFINGIDVFTLETSLGHSSMEMVRRYVNVAQLDTGRIQRKASPAANLGSWASLEMCRRYLALVQDDLKIAMQTLSPADRWGL